MPPKPQRTNKGLSVLFWMIILGIGWCALVSLWAFTSTESGAGDFVFFFVLPAIFALFALSILYAGIVFIRRLRHRYVRRRDSIAALLLFIVLLVSVGFIVFTENKTISDNQKALKQYALQRQQEYTANGGPTAYQIEKIKMGTIDQFTMLMNNCEVAGIMYSRFAPAGPLEEKNTYIAVKTRQQSGNTHGPDLPWAGLPLSEKATVESLVKKNNDQLTGPWPACKIPISIENQPTF